MTDVTNVCLLSGKNKIYTLIKNWWAQAAAQIEDHQLAVCWDSVTFNIT